MTGCFYCCLACSSKPKQEQYLVSWASPQLHDIDALNRMVDPALRGLYPPKSLSRFADVIVLCVQVIVVYTETNMIFIATAS